MSNVVREANACSYGWRLIRQRSVRSGQSSFRKSATYDFRVSRSFCRPRVRRSAFGRQSRRVFNQSPVSDSRKKRTESERFR